MVNEYIKSICCDDFTTKHFRTWMGTVYAIKALKDLGCWETEAEKKRKNCQGSGHSSDALG